MLSACITSTVGLTRVLTRHLHLPDYVNTCAANFRNIDGQLRFRDQANELVADLAASPLRRSCRRPRTRPPAET